ncbi:MAG: hypothetical protein K0R98_639 [Rickettsiaceae bacterium]|jgi:septal ring factor EnvC (AmiA/AmiB activator)|nr:hypothetical protein [Rickettsiaceae bacterium]
MNTKLKTLLIASALSLTLSACAHNGKNSSRPCDKDGKCPIVASLDKSKDKLKAITKDAESISKDSSDAAVKAHLDKISKDIGEVAKDLKETQKEIAKIKRTVGKKDVKAPAKADAKSAAPAKK